MNAKVKMNPQIQELLSQPHQALVNTRTLVKKEDIPQEKGINMVANVPNASLKLAQTGSLEASDQEVVKKPKAPRKPRAKAAVQATTTQSNQTPVNSAPVSPVQPQRPSASELGFGDLLMYFFKGLTDVYYKSAQKTMLPLMFVFKHLITIAKGFAHISAPALLTYWMTSKIVFISTIMAQSSLAIVATYYLCFYIANAFLWVSGWMSAVTMLASLKKSIYSLAEIGRKIN